MTAPHGAAPDEHDGDSPRPGGAVDSLFTEPAGDLSVRIGTAQIDIENRWEAVSILNDIMTGSWFLTGSIMNLVGGFGDVPLFFYLAGSSQLLLRAVLRLGRRIHIARGYTRTRPRIYRPDIDSR